MLTHEGQGAGQSPKVTAVVPTYNSGELIDRCLAALAASDAVDEAIVLDGGSTDGTDERAAGWPGVRAVRLEGTTLAHRLNKGVREARNEFVIVLNDDAFVDPDTPARLAEVMVERPRVGVAGACLRYEDGRPQRSAGHYKTLSEVTLGALALDRLAARVGNSTVSAEDGTGIVRATWTPLCASLVRKSAFQEVGGYDERFGFYGDDQDFARKVTEAGWETVVRNDAGAIHLRGAATSSTDPGPWFSRFHQSRFLYLKKHYPRGWRLYAVAWAVRATIHMALWRTRALIHRLRGDRERERAASGWVSAFRQARRPSPPAAQ